METDFQITVKGLYEERARQIGAIVIEVIRSLESLDESIDLRRMHRLILTTDFDKEMKEISKASALETPIEYTHEGGVTAIAKVLELPLGDDFEILLVFNAHLLSALFPKDDNDFGKDDSITAIHYLHHEFWHIHEKNRQLDAFYQTGLTPVYTGKDTIIRPFSEACWSEYFACRMSASTCRGDPFKYTAEIFTNTLTQAKPTIDKEILSYRYHADMDRLMKSIRPTASRLAKTAAYILGYLDGIGTLFTDFSPKVAESLSGSYFETTWDAMHEALSKMFERYSDDYESVAFYDELVSVIENYYEVLGLIFSNDENGIYVDVPFRPETTP
jgi:hypothetical protein